MSREKIARISIGCPTPEREPPCQRCGGNWPGTMAPSQKLVVAALRGRLDPEKLGCQPLVDQGRFLVQFVEARFSLPPRVPSNISRASAIDDD